MEVVVEVDPLCAHLYDDRVIGSGEPMLLVKHQFCGGRLKGEGGSAVSCSRSHLVSIAIGFACHEGSGGGDEPQ